MGKIKGQGQVAVKEIILPMKAYRNDDFVEGTELPVRFNQLSEIRLMKYLNGSKEQLI